MSLQAKFASLLGLMSAAVLLALAASIIGITVMHTEVRRPLELMSSALIELQEMKYAIERQRALLASRAPITAESESPAELYEAEARRIKTAISTLLANDALVTLTGKTSLANVRSRIDAAGAAALSALTGGDNDRAAEADESLEHAFLLIRRMESRIIEDTHRLLAYSTDLRWHLLWIAGIVLLLLVLSLVLGMLLVRRWVLRPVAELRAAAGRIAAGDFQTRLAVRGRDELSALSAEVNTMAGMVKTLQDEAVQRERLAAIGEMVRRIAHNLRSPLAGIRGLAEMTRMELSTSSLPESIRADIGENQQRIIGAVDRFELWLRELLSAARPLEILHQTVDPRQWLANVVEPYRAKAHANGVLLDTDADAAPPLAAFDPRHLEHALGAIIANAIEAAGAQADTPGRVRIVCRTRQDGEHGQTWQLRVEDNGSGIPPDLRERIFAPYFTTKREGTGIGLAVARQVVRAHGGDLTLEAPVLPPTAQGPDPGTSGAVFSAWLPIGPIDSGSTTVANTGHSESLSGQSSRH